VSVTTVGAAIASVQEGITGITTAYAHDELPGQLRTSELPAFLNFPGEATYAVMTGGGTVRETRQWRMQLYVTPIERDTDPGRQGAAVEPFFRRTFAEFLDSYLLESLGDLCNITLTGDTGWSVMEWGGSRYVGAEFTLEVVEVWEASDYTP